MWSRDETRRFKICGDFERRFCKHNMTESPRRRRKAWERLDSELPPMPSEAPDADKIYGPNSSLALEPHPEFWHSEGTAHLLIKRHLKPLTHHVAERVACTFTDVSGNKSPAIALFFDPLFVPSDCLPWIWKHDSVTEQRHEAEAAISEVREDKGRGAESNESGWKKYFEKTPPLVCPSKEVSANRCKPRPIVQTRAQYCREFFFREANVYKSLLNEQGYLISRCYGAFVVNFNDREHEDDKIVNVLVLENVGGGTLGKSKNLLSALSDDQKRFIAKEVERIHDLLECWMGLLWANVVAGNFMIVKCNNEHGLRVVAFEFMAACENFGAGISPRRLLKRNIDYSRTWLKELGLGDYIEVSNDIAKME